MALLGIIVLEDQGDGIRDQPLPGVKAHSAVLSRDTEQQVCRQNAAGADKGMAATVETPGPLSTPIFGN